MRERERVCARVQLGTYDPIPYGLDAVKEVRLRLDRIKYWLATGAVPSDRVAYLLWRAGLVPMPPIHHTRVASIPKEQRKGAKKFHTLAHAHTPSHTAPAAASASVAAAVAASRASVSSTRGVAFAGLFSRPAALPLR